MPTKPPAGASGEYGRLYYLWDAKAGKHARLPLDQLKEYTKMHFGTDTPETLQRAAEDFRSHWAVKIKKTSRGTREFRIETWKDGKRSFPAIAEEKMLQYIADKGLDIRTVPRLNKIFWELKHTETIKNPGKKRPVVPEGQSAWVGDTFYRWRQGKHHGLPRRDIDIVTSRFPAASTPELAANVILDHQRNLRARGEGYDPVKNVYTFLLGRQKHELPYTGNVKEYSTTTNIPRKQELRAGLLKGLANAIAPKATGYVTFGNRRFRTKVLDALIASGKHPGATNYASAAQVYRTMNDARVPAGESGWAVNVKDPDFDRKYYLWTGKRHYPIRRQNMDAALGETDVEKAGYARVAHRSGWSADGMVRRVVNPVTHKIARIRDDVFQRARQRLEAMGRAASDEAVTNAVLRGRRLRASKADGYFDYNRNDWVDTKAAVRVPGAVFATKYKKFAPTNGTVARTMAEIGPEIVRQHVEDILVAKFLEDENARRGVDVAWLRDLPGVTTNEFQARLAAVFDIGGPLRQRPLLTGNVGKPSSTESPLAQMRAGMSTDGCKTLKEQWPFGLGKSLQIHQSVVLVMANLRAKDAIRTPGLLAAHSTGAGKTLEGLCVMVAFWNKTFDDGKPWGILPVSVRSNQSGNDLNTLAELGTAFFPWFRSTYDGKESYPFARGKTAAKNALSARLRAGQYAVGLKSIKKVIPENHLLQSYATMAHDMPKKKPLRHCVFILDELQMLFNISGAEAGFHKEYNVMKKFLMVDRDPSTTWVFAMTATPEPLNRVLECVSPGMTGAFDTPEGIGKHARGLVSVANVSGDVSKFAKVEVVHECSRLHSDAYREAYMEALGKLYETAAAVKGQVPKDTRDPPKGLKTHVYRYNAANDARGRFWTRVRRRSEWVKVGTYAASSGKNDSDTEESDPDVVVPDVDGFTASDSVRGRDGRGKHVYLLSPKIINVINTVVTAPGLHYVYSPDWTTLRLIAWVLRSVYTFRQFKAGDRGATLRFGFLNQMTKPKSQMHDPVTNTYGTIGAVTAADVDDLISKKDKKPKGILTTKTGNKNGSVVKVVLATKDAYKGVDTYGVRHLHLTSAFVEFTDLIQFVGRGPRLCSHDAFPLDRRVVTVHVNSLAPPGGGQCRPVPSGNHLADNLVNQGRLWPDCYVFQRSVARYKAGWQRTEDALARVAVDAVLFGEFNKYPFQLYTKLVAPCTDIMKKRKRANDSNDEYAQHLVPVKSKKSRWTYRGKDTYRALADIRKQRVAKKKV